ncbi:MAG TPA: TATA-box-binding protein [archaeon]|nr:TATA-box-binding protein [archaeon]
MLEIKIHNMVITVHLSDRIDLDKLASKLPSGAEYFPDNFPGVVYRMEKPRASFLIFSTGKALCTGTASEKDAKEAIENMLKLLKDMRINVKTPKIEIQNIVASTKIDTRLDIDKMAFELENTEYEPETFPGLVYKMKGSVTFLIFGTGKIVCVGARSTKDIKESLNRLVKKLRKFKL